MGLESKAQSSIIQYLQILENQGKCYFVRVNSFSGSITRSNGSKGYIKNNKPGCPDIIVCFSGIFIGLEVKSESKQSEDQLQAEQSIKKSKGMYFIVHDVDDVRIIGEMASDLTKDRDYTLKKLETYYFEHSGKNGLSEL